MGRPTDYKPEYCQALIEHMEKGLSFEAFAGVVGCSRRVLWDWEKVHPDFLHAKEVGISKAQIFWENLGINHVVNQSKSFGQGVSQSKSLNASVWIFNMKNRFQWRDKQPDEHDTVVNNIAAVPDADFEARYQAAVAKAIKDVTPETAPQPEPEKEDEKPSE